MKLDIYASSKGWLMDVLRPEQAAMAAGRSVGYWIRQGLAVVLSALLLMIPMGQGIAFAQDYPPAPVDTGQIPQQQALSAGQLDDLVAPIALYPDGLLAQVLAAATYPSQVVEADRWVRAQRNAPAEQIAAGAEAENWDASVKALTAFPTVLAQMDRNIEWTTDLGNAYYNQPQDLMDAVQAMRQKAQSAGQLSSTPQQAVGTDDGAITIAPANPTVVYVPVYNPWTVYGAPLAVYPGYDYAPPAGVFWGGLAVGFAAAVGIGLFAHSPWGWGHWGMGWGSHAVYFNHNRFFTHSTTVFNRGLNRPGGPPRNFQGRGAYARSFEGRGEAFRGSGRGFGQAGGSYRSALGSNGVGSNYNRTSIYSRPNIGYRAGVNRPDRSFTRPSTSYRAEANRFGGNYSRPNIGYRTGVNRPERSFTRPSTSYRAEANRWGGHYRRQAGAANHFSERNRRASAPRGSMNHPTFARAFARGGGGHASGGHGGGHPSGGHGGGHHHG